ncbi:MAG: thiol oxidoreductase [Burkholderiales bacterium]|nr:thiol oxidoreductase [Burkholderiales bacterium]
MSLSPLRGVLATAALIPSGLAALSLADRDPSGPTCDSFTVADVTAHAFSRPAPTLDGHGQHRFAEGAAALQQRWVVAPSAFGRWGRGPTSNGEACGDCHPGHGRGRPPAHPDEPAVSLLVRLSIPAIVAGSPPLPHPAYGFQLQRQGTLGRVPAEGQVFVHWRARSVMLDDGEAVILREPRIELRELAFGPIGPETLRSARIAPPLIAPGLLEAVPEAALLDQMRRDVGDGIRGRLNRIGAAAGRFGWKATQPTLVDQVEATFHEDFGVTSARFPLQNCPAIQIDCRAEPAPAGPELTPDLQAAIIFHLRSLAAPARRDVADPQVRRGEAVFRAINCIGCHGAELRTGPLDGLPAMQPQTIRPWTDLLLHDMGDGLADGRPDAEAGPRDWRTAPLWGLGLSATVNGHTGLLHDGRARSPEEAILWHGGEATAVRHRYTALPKADRAALLRFLESL